MELSLEKKLTHQNFVNEINRVSDLPVLRDLVKDLMKLQVKQVGVLNNIGRGLIAQPIEIDPLITTMIGMITEAKYLKHLAISTHLLYVGNQQKASNEAKSIIADAVSVPSFQNGEEWELVS